MTPRWWWPGQPWRRRSPNLAEQEVAIRAGLRDGAAQIETSDLIVDGELSTGGPNPMRITSKPTFHYGREKPPPHVVRPAIGDMWVQTYTDDGEQNVPHVFDGYDWVRSNAVPPHIIIRKAPPHEGTPNMQHATRKPPPEPVYDVLHWADDDSNRQEVADFLRRELPLPPLNIITMINGATVQYPSDEAIEDSPFTACRGMWLVRTTSEDGQMKYGAYSTRGDLVQHYNLDDNVSPDAVVSSDEPVMSFYGDGLAKITGTLQTNAVTAQFPEVPEPTRNRKFPPPTEAISGWHGTGSNPVTDDEWAYIQQHRYGNDAYVRQHIDVVLAERPPWADAEGRSVRAEGDWPDDEPVPFVPKDDPRQPWAILADLHAVIASLLLDPDESTSPHCAEEYNAGLDNALSVIRAEVHHHGGHVDAPAIPPEDPDEVRDDETSPDPEGPQFRTINVVVPKIDMEAIGRQIEASLGSVMAQMRKDLGKAAKKAAKAAKAADQTG